MKSYTVKQEENYVVLTVLVDCCLGEAGQRRVFWAPDGPLGYVREVTAQRPGTLGQQVDRELSHMGCMASCYPQHLLAFVRDSARRALRREKRLGHR